jgi:uroporphyrinogen decarboxylase
MTPRDRVLSVLEHRRPDRLPVDLWLTPEMLDALKRHAGTGDEFTCYRRLGVDKIVGVFPGYGSGLFDPNHDSAERDPWGVPLRRVRAGAATYNEYGAGPLAGAETAGDVHDYPLWPEVDRFAYADARSVAAGARQAGFATIGPWVSFFEVYCHMRGMENALMDMADPGEVLPTLLDRIEAIQTQMLERFLAELGDLIDLVFISDDMGTQGSLLISLPAWREHLRPRLLRWTELIHRHGKRVMFHTDGAVRPLLPELLACGVDVLNPIQHVCPGMERTALKRDFGDRVVFYGGVENQRTLPFGTPDEVRAEVETCLRTLGAGGGYLPSSCHNVQAGTPVENVLAMLETVHAWRG